MARNRVYISCYSCPHSTILASANESKRIAVCGLNGNRHTIDRHAPYPAWCERLNRKGATE